MFIKIALYVRNNKVDLYISSYKYTKLSNSIAVVTSITNIIIFTDIRENREGPIRGRTAAT